MSVPLLDAVEGLRCSGGWGALLPWRASPVRRTQGFTLIELVVVVVIIGILAAIAIPKFGSTKEKAYIAGMKSDLRNLVTAQEAYFGEYVTYASTVSVLSYSVSEGDAITLVSSSASGWSATASNSGTAHTCGIFIGVATPPITGQSEGSPLCQ
jgi:prepilin-type N-terminal cleavage/methylation domain-containing protein